MVARISSNYQRLRLDALPAITRMALLQAVALFVFYHFTSLYHWVFVKAYQYNPHDYHTLYRVVNGEIGEI